MKPFLVFFLVAAAYARPEPPVGYNYPSPSFGGGSGGAGGSFGGGSGAGHDFGGAIGGHGSFGGSSGGSFGSGSGAGHDFGGAIGGHGGDFGGASLNQGFGGYDSGYSSGPTVHKHVYVHVAPEEPEERQPPKILPVSAPQKHYKIIFIKAPSAPAPTAPVIPVQPQNEEKTLVYVLVKKPEEQPEIVIPTPAPTQPSKPEVYFIRYKTQKDGGHGGDAGGDLGAGLDAPSGGYIPAPAAGSSTKYGPPGYHK